MAEKNKPSLSIPPKQLIIVSSLIIIVLLLIWQVYKLFFESAPAPVQPLTQQNQPAAARSLNSPSQSSLLANSRNTAELTEREKQLVKLQQETNAKYLGALNDLQMLKINLQVAELHRSIMKARLDTAKDEKNLISLLQPASNAQYSQSLVNPIIAGTPVVNPPQTIVTVTPPAPAVANYAVISVSQLQNKWAAVLGYQGKLYHVSVGDILPEDQSKVVNIDKSGIVLELSGKKTKISLVPII